MKIKVQVVIEADDDTRDQCISTRWWRRWWRRATVGNNVQCCTESTFLGAEAHVDVVRLVALVGEAMQFSIRVFKVIGTLRKVFNTSR